MKKSFVATLVVLPALALLALALFQQADTTVGAQPSGFRALSGAAARAFVLPGDVRLVKSVRLDKYGVTYERYQQYLGSAQVLGGEIALYRDDAGSVTTVIGAHYPAPVPTTPPR